MPGADWRSKSAYCEVEKAQTVDLAWEWLRRDREYHKDFRILLCGKQSSEMADHFRRKWGLTFRS
ncbi:transcriptional regulator domain-containing protein [Bradyrhizobium sp. ORS 86]|uniref:transcriptional regulator domain-containing protein n=1 Tax=Bradyrhizobium sp. ORS 86 TaxID=1685970 RepID=UPI00388FF4B1